MPRDRERDRDAKREPLADQPPRCERELRNLFELHLRFRENAIEKYYTAPGTRLLPLDAWVRVLSNYITSAEGLADRAEALARAGFRQADFHDEPGDGTKIICASRNGPFAFRRPAPQAVFSLSVVGEQLQWFKFDSESMWPAFRMSLRQEIAATAY